MAINKNFVIKNGVQVATDLIVGDSDTKKVGIGTTVAGYTLHVGATNAGGRGGIGATDAVITGARAGWLFHLDGRQMALKQGADRFWFPALLGASFRCVQFFHGRQYVSTQRRTVQGAGGIERPAILHHACDGRFRVAVSR